MKTIDEIKYTLSQMLDGIRLVHTFAVCEAAVALAERFGADKNKAYHAALLHDCARGFDREQLLNYCLEYGIELDEHMKNDINPVHALVGADMAKRRFGINDSEILDAIRRHAVGYEDMTILDKILFIADGIEPNRIGKDADEARTAAESDLDEAIFPVMRIKTYYLKEKPMHPNSVMMINKSNEIKAMKSIAPYFDWVQKVCVENNINLDGKITQVKDEKLFCISSSVGDLYLKKMTSFIIDEIIFTKKLMDLGIIALPKWIGYDHEMKVCLMRDMGGDDLSLLQSLDMETALKMFISLSCIQKASIQYVKSKDFYGVDFRIGTMIDEIRDLPETAYNMLSDTQYKITQDETDKLKRNTTYAGTVLESINGLLLPDTIHHGDLGTYNVRIVNGESIFYDWGCGGVSHPFFDTFRLLSSIRNKLPTDVPAKEIIIDTYLREWSEYGSCDELKSIFSAIDGLAGFYMMYCKYIRAKNLYLFYAENPKAINTDGQGLNERYSNTTTYLKRFISTNF